MPSPLTSPETYQAFIYGLPDLYNSIRKSTLAYIPTGRRYGRVEGILFFDDRVLCVQEFLNFELGVIEGYGYEVSQPELSINDPEFPESGEYCKSSYPHKEKLYWYDSFPHPHVPELASTDPHHKHVPPNIKHNRIPAPELSFTSPNLHFLIQEIQDALEKQTE